MSGSSPPDPDDDRPTIVPAYDVEELARGTRPSASPPSSSFAPEGETPTVIPPFDVEEMARASSSASTPSPSSPPVENDAATVIPPFDVGMAIRGRSSAAPDAASSLFSREGETPTAERPFDIGAVRLASMISFPGIVVEVDARSSSVPDSRESPGDEPAIEIQAEEDADLDLLSEAHALTDDNDETAGLAILEGILERAPLDAAAGQLAVASDITLTERHVEHLGSLESVPKLAIPLARLVSLSLDHRAGFLLSLVDGRSSLALIIDLSGMAGSEVLGTLADLKECGIITFGG